MSQFLFTHRANLSFQTSKNEVWLTVLMLVGSYTSGGQTASAIVQNTDAKMKGNTSQAQNTIQTVRPTWSREMTVNVDEKFRPCNDPHLISE